MWCNLEFNFASGLWKPEVGLALSVVAWLLDAPCGFDKKSRRDWINYRCHAVCKNPLKSLRNPFIKKLLVELLMGRGDGELFTDISHLMDCTIKNNFPLSVFTPPYIFRFRTVVVWNPNFKPLWNYFLPFLNNTKRVLTVKGVNRSIECRGFGGCSSPGITTWQKVQYISKAVTFQICQVAK